MATVAEFTADESAFGLGVLCRLLPGAAIDLERVVPAGEALCPYLWIRGVSAETVAKTLSERLDAATLTLVDELGDRGMLIRIDWRDDDGLLGVIVEAPVTLLTGRCDGNGWTFRVRADDHQDLAAFHRICADAGIPIRFDRVQPLVYAEDEGEGALTPAQLEALELAYVRGYFHEPRRATLDDLAGELEISRQSLAGRLRRGHRNLLGGLFDDTGRRLFTPDDDPG